jgi:hypothetical protein
MGVGAGGFSREPNKGRNIYYELSAKEAPFPKRRGQMLSETAKKNWRPQPSLFRNDAFCPVPFLPSKSKGLLVECHGLNGGVYVDKRCTENP